MSRLRVLIVDDSDIETNIIANALKHACINFRICNDSTKAMNIICEYEPTIVILDLNMPNISGIDLGKLIKTNPLTSHIRLMIMTANDNIEDILEGVQLQIVDYIQKPMPVKRLLEQILLHDFKASLTDDFKVFQRRIEHNTQKYCH